MNCGVSALQLVIRRLPTYPNGREKKLTRGNSDESSPLATTIQSQVSVAPASCSFPHPLHLLRVLPLRPRLYRRPRLGHPFLRRHLVTVSSRSIPSRLLRLLLRPLTNTSGTFQDTPDDHPFQVLHIASSSAASHHDLIPEQGPDLVGGAPLVDSDSCTARVRLDGGPIATSSLLTTALLDIGSPAS